MITCSSELVDVRARLARLERHNRRLQRGAALAIILGVAVAAAGWLPFGHAQSKDKSAQIVEAQRFVVRDAKGKMRAALALFSTGPGVALFDENEKQRASIHLTSQSYGLVLHDEQDKPLVALETNGKGSAGLTFRTGNNQTRLNLSTTPGGRGLELHDGTGQRRALLMVDDQKGTGLQLYDRAGKIGVTLGADDKAGAGIELKNSKGKVTFTKP